MDNFDLKKFLVENKLTYQERMKEAAQNHEKMNEAVDLKKVAELMKAKKYNELSKLPGDAELVKKILPLLKNTQIGKDFTAWAQQNKQSVLSEGAVKNTLLGLLVAGVLGLGVSSALDQSTRNKETDKAVTTQKSQQGDDYTKGYIMLDFYKNNKSKIQSLAKDNLDVKIFADEMETLSKSNDGGELMKSMGGDKTIQDNFNTVKKQVDSSSTAQFK